MLAMDSPYHLYNFVTAVFGFVFNSLVVLVISRHKGTDVMSSFVSLIAIADSLYLLSGPFINFIVSTRHLSMTCRLFGIQTLFTHFSASGTSILLSIVAIDRIVCLSFVALKNPNTRRKLFRIGCALSCVSLLGIYCLVTFVLGFRSTKSCGLPKEFSYFEIIIQFIIPSIAILIGIGFIICSFRRLNNPQTHAQVVSISTLFFICLGASFAIFASPLYVFDLWMMKDWTQYDRTVHIVVVCLYNTQAAMKLFVYITFVGEFKQNFVKMFFKWIRAIKRDRRQLDDTNTDILKEMETGEADHF